MKWTKKQKALVDKQIVWLLDEFCLLPASVQIEFINLKKGQKISDLPTMTVINYYPYREYVFECYPMLLEINHEKRMQAMVHEIMHCVLWKLKHFRTANDKVYRSIEEETVELLASVLYRHYIGSPSDNNSLPRQE